MFKYQEAIALHQRDDANCYFQEPFLVKEKEKEDSGGRA